MTSGKMRREEREALKEWTDSFNKCNDIDNVSDRKPTERDIIAFKSGFRITWRRILSDKKLYRTFNLRWEKVSPGHLLLKDNDERIIAIMLYYKSLSRNFKYNINIMSDYMIAYQDYKTVVDMNDIHRLKAYYKDKVIEDYKNLVIP